MRREAVDAQQRAEQAGKAERREGYRANIAAAAAALQLQNSGTARRDLEAATPEHRDWEWQTPAQPARQRSRRDGRGHASLGSVELPILSPSATSSPPRTRIYASSTSGT